MRSFLLLCILLVTLSLCGCETGRGLKKDLRQVGKEIGSGLSETGRAIKESVK